MNRKELRKQVTITDQGGDKPLCDATTLLANADAFEAARGELAKLCKKLGACSVAVSPDGLGLALGAAVATINRTGFVPVMTADNLPENAVVAREGNAARKPLMLPAAAVKPGQKVIIVDDILASGRTTLAIAKAVEQQGGEVAGIVTLVELTQRRGRMMLEGRGYAVRSVLRYGDRH